MEQPRQETTELSVKDMSRLKIAISGLAAGKTYTQIKDEIGISRPTLYALMRKQGSQELLKAEVVEIATQIRQIIQELLTSGSKVDKRFALQELSKIHKQFNDKVTPSLSQTTTVTVDLNKLQTIEQQIYETLNRLPPNTRTAFWTQWNQVTQEWKTQPLDNLAL